MKKDLKLYWRLLRQAMPYWRVALLSILAMLASAALEPALPALMQPLIDQSLIAKDQTSLWQVPLLIMLAFLGKGIADYVSNVASQTVAQKTIEDLRAQIFDHELSLSLTRHQEEEAGRMLTRITFDTNLVSEAVSTAWLTIIRDSLVLAGLMGFLIYTAWKLTLLIFLIAPALAFAIRMTNQRLRTSGERVQRWMGRLSGLIEESLLGLAEIKIFSAEKSQSLRFRETSRQLRQEQLRAIRVQALNVPLVQVLAASSVALVIYVASEMSQSDQLSPGAFVSYVTAMSMVFEPIRRLTNVNSVLQRGLAAADSLFGLLDEPIEDQRSDQAKQAFSQGQVRGAIGFHKVSFAYPGQPKPVLNHFDLEIQPGETVALVGPSGSGKSTLLKLLAGFVRPNSGQVTIDGVEINQVSRSDLRSQIALVSQRVMLFDLSIRENITLGRAGIQETAVVAAAKAAHAWEFIEKLPKGLDTPIGSLGDRLSGGQRQRIAIARAFLKDAPILLLDEATSALDSDSERAVLLGLNSLMKNRTVIMVSHAPERLLHVDRIIEFQSS